MDDENIDNSAGENAQKADSEKSPFEDLPIIWVLGNCLIVKKYCSVIVIIV